MIEYRGNLIEPKAYNSEDYAFDCDGEMWIKGFTLRAAMEKQSSQLGHYCDSLPTEAAKELREHIRSKTNIEGWDVDTVYPVALINACVPRGGCIESKFYELRKQYTGR